MAHYDSDLWLGLITAAPVTMVAFIQTLSDLLAANDRLGTDNRLRTYWWIVAWVYATPVGAGALTALAAAELAWHWAVPVLGYLAVATFVLVLFGTVSSAVTLRSLGRRSTAQPPVTTVSLFAWRRRAVQRGTIRKPPVGTWPWSTATGGVLRRRDKAELVRLAGLLGLHVPALVLFRLHVLPWWPPRPLDTEAALRRRCEPDGAAARQVRDVLESEAPPYLVNHSLRCYWLSRAIAESTGLPFDDELLYVAGLAHDLGLVEAGASAPDGDGCFAVRGARRAVAIARAAGWDDRRLERLAEAITLNLNGTVPRRRGTEARSLMMGVLADATGIHRWRVHRGTVRAIYRVHPMLDQQPRLRRSFVADANRSPRCRGHFAVHRLGFGVLMRCGPRVRHDLRPDSAPPA